MITFESKLEWLNSWTILRLPPSASAKLPSRGLVMVAGILNGSPFQAPLEPDGKGSHWLKISDSLCQESIGSIAKLQLEPIKEWPEPEIPADLQAALGADPQLLPLWNDVTPMARWDWIRWINSTNKAETRSKRIRVAASKLKAGMHRPCCFNRSICCEPQVSKNGILLEPTDLTEEVHPLVGGKPNPQRRMR